MYMDSKQGNKKIGGQGLHVEIEESLYIRRKYMGLADAFHNSGFLVESVGETMNVLLSMSIIGVPKS